MLEQIQIEQIKRADIADFWDLHWEYLKRDIFPFDECESFKEEEEQEYFRSEKYRGTMERFMERDVDPAHMVYFCRKGQHIGCAEYVTYLSEDGKCLLMDFWVFPECRGEGTGHGCWETLKKCVQEDGARYVQINVSNERSRRFWLSNGFVDDGTDEWNEPLMRLEL